MMKGRAARIGLEFGALAMTEKRNSQYKKGSGWIVRVSRPLPRTGSSFRIAPDLPLFAAGPGGAASWTGFPEGFSPCCPCGLFV